METPVVAEPIPTAVIGAEPSASAEPEKPALQPEKPERPSVGIHELSREERREFLKTGKLPDRAAKEPTADVPADSSPAKPVDQAASTDALTAAASEPAKPTPKDDSRKKASTEERFNQLLEDRARYRERAEGADRRVKELEARLAALESGKPGASADSPSAPDPSENPRAYAKLKGYPKLDDFDGDVDEWQAAASAFIAEHVAKRHLETELSARDARMREEQRLAWELNRVIDEAGKRLEQERAADPSLVSKVHPQFRSLPPARSLLPNEIGPHHLIKDFVMFESQHPLSLSVYFSTEAGQQEFARLRDGVINGSLSIRQMEFALAKLDASVTPADKPRGEGSGGAGSVPRKEFTKAPDPPAQIRKDAGGGDAIERAVKAGDADAFIAEMDRREGTTTRRWGRRRA